MYIEVLFHVNFQDALDMALPASQLASRIPDPYIHMWAASLLRGEKSHVKCMLLPYFLPLTTDFFVKFEKLYIVKPVLSGHGIKQTPSITQTVAKVPKLISFFLL